MDSHENVHNLSALESLHRLKDGNKRFVRDMLDNKLQDSERRKAIMHEQKPFAIILSCADSRVVPEFAFDTGLGELFVIRVAGNIANSSSIASIEYAVAHLGTNLIIVLGHQNCGAVTAAVAGGDNGKHLNHLLAHINPAIKLSKSPASVDDISIINAKLTAEELKEKSTIIYEAIKTRNLKIIPAFYHLHTGKVDFH